MDVQIIAHRGSSLLAPENTLAATRLAWDEGADAVETDVRLTRDGHLVALHDATLARTAKLDRPIDAVSLDALRHLDAGSWKHARFAGEPVPTLADLLGTTPAGKRFFVEMKCGVEGVEPLKRVIADSNLQPDQIVPIALDLSVAVAIKKSVPDSPVYWVVQFKHDRSGIWQPTVDEMLRRAADAGVDGLDLMAGGPLDSAMADRIRAAGLPWCAWTVDDPQLARWLIDLGVEGITTNRPGWLREQLMQ